MPLSKPESTARALLRHYLPRERFVFNSRPDWLKYPPTGRNLELDIFLPARSVAIEVDGAQHGRHIPGLQSTFSDFVTQQSRDMYKLEACAHRHVALYKLTSFDLTQRRFEPFIRNLLTEAEWQRVTPPLHLYRQAEMVTRMKVVTVRTRRMRNRTIWQRLIRLFWPMAG